MSNKLDKIVVVDLEATCWQNEDGSKTPPAGEQSEIIEIGACFLDCQTGKISHKASYIIKPRYSKISKFCVELTGITQEIVDQGLHFEHAVNKFKKEFGIKNRVWATWGDYDRVHFERNCKLYNIEYPFGAKHINAKTLFALLNGMSREIGVAKALEYCGMNFIGKPHRGDDDAYNTARIIGKILRK